MSLQPSIYPLDDILEKNEFEHQWAEALRNASRTQLTNWLPNFAAHYFVLFKNLKNPLPDPKFLFS